MVLLTGAHDAAAPELAALLREASDNVPSRVVFDAPELLHLPLGARVVLVEPGPHARWLNLHRPVVRQRRLTVLLWCGQSCVDALKRGAPDFMDWISHRIEVPPMLPRYLVEALSACESEGQISGLIHAPPPPYPWRTISALTPYEALRDACRNGPIWVTDVGDALSWLGARIAHIEGGGKHGLILADPRVQGDGDPWIDARPVPWREAARWLEAQGVAEPGLIAALKGLDPKAFGVEHAGPLKLAIDPRWKTILIFAREAPDMASICLASELELVSVVETWLKEADATTTDDFFGRTHELAQLAQALLPAAGPPRPVALQGSAGVGKSFLVDHFAREHAGDFPGGYHVLALAPDSAPSIDTLGGRLATLIGQRGWGSPGAWDELVARLRAPAALVHVENVNSAGLVDAIVELAYRLTGCALVVSGRSRRFGRQPPFQVLAIQPMDEPTALAQLAAELGPARDASDFAERRHLAVALGYLPLALHLAAGYLADGHSVGRFLERLRGLTLDPADLADLGDRLDHAGFVLSTTFALSLDLLARRFDAAAMAGFAILGHAPGAGVRGSLGAAMAGLKEDTFDALMVEAVRLSLASGSADAGWSIHPLLAEMLRGRVPDRAWLDRMTAWFVARLPARPPGEEDAQGRCWGEIQREGAALEQWLQQVPDADLATVERVGSAFAVQSGPFRMWMTFCERVLERVEDPQARSNALWTLTQVARNAGDLERAVDAAAKKRSLDLERGNGREAALAVGALTDILQARGELDEALRIRREEQLPVYERLGDVRSLLVGRANLALALLTRNEKGDRAEAGQLLALALQAAEALRLPEAVTIQAIQRKHGV